MFPSLTDDQREFVSNIATIKDGKVGFDIPKNMVQQMGLTNVKDGFVSLSDLTDKQLAELQDLQKKAADEKPIDIARNQFNETTKILNVATAIYLRLMEDVRSGPAGDAAANLMKKAVDFTEKINPTQNNSAQTMKQVYGEATGAAGEALDKIIDKVKGGMPKEVQETIKYLETKLSDITKDLNIQEKATEVLEKAKELIERGIEKGKDAYEGLKGFTGSVDIKVDINSNSTQLAGIVVDELSKNPQMRAEFVSNIVKSTKTYA